jgi:archaeal type IV pilus assembly protein PilA
MKTRNDEGVSPVIAVILLVAITVVLATTVYVFVNQITPDGIEMSNVQMSMRDAPEVLDNNLNDLIILRHVGGDCTSTNNWEIRFNGNVTIAEYEKNNFCIGDELVVSENENIPAETYDVTIVDTAKGLIIFSNKIFIR